MRRKLGKTELLALLTIAGVSTGAAQAAKVDGDNAGNKSLQVIEQTQTQLGSGKDSACGKGSCGTDEDGAKKAAEKHKADATKKAPAKKSGKEATGDKKATDKKAAEKSK